MSDLVRKAGRKVYWCRTMRVWVYEFFPDYQMRLCMSMSKTYLHYKVLVLLKEKFLSMHDIENFRLEDYDIAKSKNLDEPDSNMLDNNFYAAPFLFAFKNSFHCFR